MKVTISHDGANAHGKERMAWAKCLSYCGHEVSFWDIRGKSPYDQWDEFQPDLFLGQGYNLSDSLISVLHECPNTKVWLKLGDNGQICSKYDLTKYQILVASDDEKNKVERLVKGLNTQIYGGAHYWIGRENDSHGFWKDVIPLHITLASDVFLYTNSHEIPELKCDIGLISGLWPYKEKTFHKYLYPLMNPSENFNIKIFGYNWGTPFYCGPIDDELEKHALRSQTISLNLHEPHALDSELGLELNERSFKLLSNKCFVISDRPHDLSTHIFNNEEIVFAKNPDQFKTLIKHYLSHKHEIEPFRERGYQKVIGSETYFHRMARLFGILFDEIQEKKILEGYEKVKLELKL